MNLLFLGKTWIWGGGFEPLTKLQRCLVVRSLILCPSAFFSSIGLEGGARFLHGACSDSGQRLLDSSRHVVKSRYLSPQKLYRPRRQHHRMTLLIRLQHDLIALFPISRHLAGVCIGGIRNGHSQESEYVSEAGIYRTPLEA